MSQETNNLPLKAFELSKAFKRDIAKLARSTPEILVSPRYTEVFQYLIKGQKLPAIYKDHALEGDMLGMRDCHIYNDLLLIYEIKADLISFVRLGTHSEIFKKN